MKVDLLPKFKKKSSEFDVDKEKQTNSAAPPSRIHLGNKPNLFYMFEFDLEDLDTESSSQLNTKPKGLTFVLIISSMLLAIKSYRMLTKENNANIMQLLAIQVWKNKVKQPYNNHTSNTTGNTTNNSSLGIHTREANNDTDPAQHN